MLISLCVRPNLNGFFCCSNGLVRLTASSLCENIPLEPTREYSEIIESIVLPSGSFVIFSVNTGFPSTTS